MIIEGICSLFFGLIHLLIGALSFSGFTVPAWSADAAALLGRALFFFPVDVWSVVIGSFLFWTGVHFVYAILEWIWKKIPGVD